MLSKITLKDFQCHRRLEIELDPSVTVIVGSSDSGKSAVIRALGLVALNRPTGDAFVRRGAESCCVSLSTVDGVEVDRKKGGGVNEYRVNGTVMTAFGQDVPPAVRQSLNLDELSIQAQYDGPFWLCETAGEVSRRLNQIVDLGVIDWSLSSVASMLREQQAKHRVLEQQRGEASDEVASTRYAREMEAELAAVEAVGKQLREASQNRRALAVLVAGVVAHKAAAENATRKRAAACAALEIGEQWEGVAALVGGLRKCLAGIHQKKAVVDKGAVLDMVEAELDRVIQCKRALDEVGSARGSMRSMISMVRGIEKEVHLCQQRLHAAETEMAAGMGKECPLCGALLG